MDRNGGLLRILIVEMVTQNALSIAVYEKVDSAGRNDTDQIRSQALEQRAPSLMDMYRAEDLESFAKM